MWKLFECGYVHEMLVFPPHCGDNAKVKHYSFPRLSHSLPRGWAVVTNDLVHKYKYCDPAKLFLRMRHIFPAVFTQRRQYRKNMHYRLRRETIVVSCTSYSPFTGSGFYPVPATWFWRENYTSAVRFEKKSLVCSCRIIIPLYVYESKYSNVTCFMKIIPFFLMTRPTQAYFANVSCICSLHISEESLHSKYFSLFFRCQQFFQHLLKHMPEKK